MRRRHYTSSAQCYSHARQHQRRGAENLSRRLCDPAGDGDTVMRGQTDAQVAVDQVQQATNRRNIDRSDARARPPVHVNARVSDNYYQTGCVARPDVQISRRMRTACPSIRPAAAAHPFRQRSDETARCATKRKSDDVSNMHQQQQLLQPHHLRCVT